MSRLVIVPHTYSIIVIITGSGNMYLPYELIVSLQYLTTACKVGLVATSLIVAKRTIPIVTSLFHKSLIDPIKWESLSIIKDNVTPSLINISHTKVGLDYVYQLPYGITVSQIINQQSAIEMILKSHIKITLDDNYLVHISTVNTNYSDCYKINLQDELIQGLKLNIGKKLDNSNMVLDLTGSECHTLVVGASGSGKSVSLNIIVAQLILKDLELYIVDPKRVEYTLYMDYPKLMSLAVTNEEIETTLSNVVSIMNTRYETLAQAKCKNHTDYNRRNPKTQMKPIVLLIDEFSVIKPKSKLYPYNTYDHLFNLLARARACNILVILCTQRPSSKVISGDLRCNIQNTLCYKVEQEVDSEIALAQKGNYSAAKIKECGVGILKSKGETVEFKGYFLHDEEILKQISHKLTGNTNLNKTIIPKQPNLNIERVIPIISKPKNQTPQVITDNQEAKKIKLFKR